MVQLTLLLDSPDDTVIQVRICRPRPTVVDTTAEPAPERPGLVKCGQVIDLRRRAGGSR